MKVRLKYATFLVTYIWLQFSFLRKLTCTHSILKTPTCMRYTRYNWMNKLVFTTVFQKPNYHMCFKYFSGYSDNFQIVLFSHRSHKTFVNVFLYDNNLLTQMYLDTNSRITQWDGETDSFLIIDCSHRSLWRGPNTGCN